MNLFTKSLAEGISTRILAGIITFVGIMVLVGWVAINEGGRMVAFEQRFEARSIERGANLFANNCSTCHNIDGRGIVGRAPALNNPALFGHDFFPEISAELSELRPALNDLQNLPVELADLTGVPLPADEAAEGDDTTAEAATADEEAAATEEAEGDNSIIEGEGVNSTSEEVQTAQEADEALAEATAVADGDGDGDAAATGEAVTDLTDTSIDAAELDPQEAAATTQEESAVEAAEPTELSDADAARVAEINARLDELAAQYGEGDIATAESAVTARISELETQRNGQIQTAIDKGYNPDIPDRLDVVGWVSTLDQYIHTTLIHGRPGSQNYWPTGQGMSAWSQLAGGPLRDDQISDIVSYIENWERDWTLEDLLAVNQFAIVPGGGEPEIEGVGSNVSVALAAIADLPGNPQEGQVLYDSATLGCVGCHGQGIIAPATAGTYIRIVEERLTLPEFEGYTAEEYIVESILNPGAFTTPGFQPVMPANFGERISAEQLAHIVAYLESQDVE